MMDKELAELANMEVNELLAKVEFRIKQAGMVVAGASGLGSFTAISHYASQYVEDGPIAVEFKNGKGRWKTYMRISKSIEPGELHEF